VISIEGIGVTPREIQDLYDKVKVVRKSLLSLELELDRSPLHNDSLTEALCNREDGDFLIVYEKNCYFFDKKPDSWDWDIKLIGRPEAIIEDEQIRDLLEEEIPDVNWVLIHTDFTDDGSNSWTPFQEHFRHRIGIIIDTACASLG
jgi:hypothetical protein